ncbi:MAG: ATP synthase subunit I [Arenicella sp.]
MSVVFKLSLWQLLVTFLFAGFCAFFWGQQHAISALVGGAICSISNVFFAGRLFVSKKTIDAEQQPQQVMRHFYRSEALKIAFTLAMFVLVFTLTKIVFMAFIIAYLLAALANWLFLPVLK